MMKAIQTLDRQLTEADAIKRTASTSLWSYIGRRFRRLQGTTPTPERIETIYYPNYIAYSTVTIPRRFASERVEKLLGGIDGLTGRTGAVDVDLPSQETRREDALRVLEPTITRNEVRDEWREWIFEYTSQKFRPIHRPDFDLDVLRLVYVPYWIVEFSESTYAISDLTKAADQITTHPQIARCYQDLIRYSVDKEQRGEFNEAGQPLLIENK
jgi:hypothetical protein